jgi:hypothetical protein
MSMDSPNEKDKDDRQLVGFAYTMSGSCQMTSRSIQEMGRRNAYPNPFFKVTLAADDFKRLAESRPSQRGRAIC